MAYEHHKGDYTKELELPIEYPFKLDHFQMHAAEAIMKDQNVLSIAHTGCGKTVLAELAIAYHLKKGGTIVYASPIKTLSNQKFASFSKKFDSVGIVTGDIQENQSSNVIIMTTEIILDMIDKSTHDYTHERYGIPEDLDKRITCVVFDEIHYMNDQQRGKNWVKLLNILNPSIQLVMLSATVSNPEEFADWIGTIKGKKTIIVSTNKRIIPLKHSILIDGYLNDNDEGPPVKEYLIQDEADNYFAEGYDHALKHFDIIQKKYFKDHKGSNRYINIHQLNKSVEYLKKKNLLNAIYFCFSIKNCMKFADLIQQPLLEDKESSIALKTFDELLLPYKKKLEERPQYHHLRKLIAKGIAYHHSGLIEVLKNAVEYLFDNSLVKVLFATETFAAGVDMPTRTVLFCGLVKPTSGGKRVLTTAEYRQMAGRAGRRGKDDKGTVFIVPVYELVQRMEMKEMMTQSVPNLTSQLKLDYQFILSMTLNDSINITNFIKRSLFYRQNKKYRDQEKKMLEQKLKDLKEPDVDITEIQNLVPIYFKEKEMTEMGFSVDTKKGSLFDLLKKKSKADPMIKFKLYQHIGYLEKQEDFARKIKELNNDEHLFQSDLLQFQIGMLVENGFLKEIVEFKDLKSTHLTPKGLVAAQIRDCNPIILTEMLFNGAFDDLSTAEIVGLMAIFINEIRVPEKITKHTREIHLYASTNIHNSLSMVEEIIEFYQGTEEENNLHRDSYWAIEYDAIDVALDWAHGKPLHKIDYIEIHDGTFIRAMIRLNNMIGGLKKIAEMKGDFELAKKLETADELILKDGATIVGVNSLYLENQKF